MIDAIVPNYNKENTISRTISSLYAQNINLNILVVDDCSADKSAEILKKRFPKVKVIKNQKNCGAAFCRNLGINSTSSELILFVDSDVRLEKNCLREMLREIKSKNLDIVFPCLFFDNGKRIRSIYDSAIFLMKRSSLERMEYPFDENFRYLEDRDFFHRAMQANINSDVAEKAIAVHYNSSKTDCEKKFLVECRDTFYSIRKGIRLKGRISLVSALKLFISALLNYNYFLNQNKFRGFGCSRFLLLKHYLAAFSESFLARDSFE